MDCSSFEQSKVIMDPLPSANLNSRHIARFAYSSDLPNDATQLLLSGVARCLHQTESVGSGLDAQIYNALHHKSRQCLHLYEC